MNDETIAAVIPLHNGRGTIEEAIRSVIDQTRPPDELILVDDGSHDGSLDVAAEAAANAPFPVRTICQANAGQSAARNAAIATTQCAFVAFLDQDDRWHRTHLEHLHAAAQRSPEVGWAYSDFNQIDHRGQLVARRFRHLLRKRPDKNSVREILMDDVYALPSASLIRRSALEACGGFDERLRGYEDDELFVRLFSAGWDFAYVPESLADHRVHGNSSSTTAHFRESRITFYREMRHRYGDLTASGEDVVSHLLRPRLMRSTLAEYSKALRFQRYAEARAITASIEGLMPDHHNGVRRHVGLALLRRPGLTRRLVLICQAVPLLRSVLPEALHVRR